MPHIFQAESVGTAWIPIRIQSGILKHSTTQIVGNLSNLSDWIPIGGLGGLGGCKGRQPNTRMCPHQARSRLEVQEATEHEKCACGHILHVWRQGGQEGPPVRHLNTKTRPWGRVFVLGFKGGVRGHLNTKIVLDG